MDEDVRLGVGRAAPEDRPVALGRLEGRRRPKLLVTGGNDVVVAVEEHGRRTLGRRDLARDDRSRAGQVDRPEVLDACVAQELDDGVVRLEERGMRVLREAPLRERRDRDEPREVLLQLRHLLADAACQRL